LRLLLLLVSFLPFLSRGELDTIGLRELARLLGEDLSDVKAQFCIARLDLDGSGGLSVDELRSW